MNPFLRYLVDKKSAHRQTDRHTPMTTRLCGLRRAGKHTNIHTSKVKTVSTPMHYVLGVDNYILKHTKLIKKHSENANIR